MSETWAWISGWAIQPDRFRAVLEEALPGYRHLVFEPNAAALDRVLATGASRIGGYSLGSLLLLAGIDRLPPEAEIYCLAPFLAFCKEAGLGGTTPEATLAAIHARLLKAPEKALKLFYRLADLKDEPTAPLPYALEDLDWGLTMLQSLRAAPEASSRVFSVIGIKDSLLDYQVFQPNWKKIVKIDASHDYRSVIYSVSHPSDL